MSERRTLTNKDLEARLKLCRDYGVASYEETADGAFKFTLGPKIIERPEREPLTVEEAQARRKAEFQRVATMHTRGGR